MDETILNYLGYVIALLFLVLPKLLKFLKQKNQQTGQSNKRPEGAGPVALPQPTREEIAAMLLNERRFNRSEVQQLVDQAQTALSQAEDIAAELSHQPRAPARLVGPIEAATIKPLGIVLKRLKERLAADDLPTEEEGEQIRSNLARLNRLVRLFASIAEQRRRPEWARTLAFLDAVAEKCLMPYLAQAERREMSYSTTLALAVVGELDGVDFRAVTAANVAPVVASRSSEREPHTWIAIAASVSLNVFLNTRSLARQIAAHFGLSFPPLILPHYSDERSFIEGLLSAMLPYIFADTGAALLLGPGFAAGLNRAFGTADDPSKALTISLSAEVVTLAPHARMFIACRVLQHLGDSAGAEKRFAAWQAKLGTPDSFVVEGFLEREIAVPVEMILGPVAELVDAMVRQPFPSLGHVPLINILERRSSAGETAKMAELTQLLLQGEPVPDVGLTLLSAAELAVEKSNALEGKIARAVIDAFSGSKREVTTARASFEPAMSLVEESIAAHFHSREHLLRAVALGATIVRPVRRVRRVRPVRPV